MKKIYVSIYGNDDNNGTLKSPYKTLQKAVNTAKSEKESYIYLREGTYAVSETVEIKDCDNITILPYKDENIRIIGAVLLDNEKVKKVTDEEVLCRLPKNAVKNILEYDLKKDNIYVAEDFCVPYEGLPTLSAEFFINSKAGILPEYPKNSWITIKKVTDKGQSLIDGDGGRRGGSFKANTKRIEKWGKADCAWVKGFFGNGYACEVLPVSKFNLETNTVFLKENGIFGINTDDPKRDYRVFNLLEELNCENEYYIDAKKGMLYFCKPKNYSNTTELALTVLKSPVISVVGCCNVKIKNITFEMGCDCGIRIFSGENNIIENCTFKNFSKNGISIGRRLGLSAEKYCVSERNFFEYDKNLTERRNHFAGENHVIKNCHIYDCGAGAIYLSGGYRPTIKSGNNTVINCDVHDCFRWQKTGIPLIAIEGVGNKISNCRIHSGSSNGIWLHGNEHIIEYNELFDLCRDIDDGGAFYMGRDPSERGNIIKYNYFHHIVSRRDVKVPVKEGFGVFSVYIDDGGSDTKIFGNVFFRGGNWAIANNGGSDIEVSNNIIIESESCIWHTDNQKGRYSEDNLPKKEKLCISHSHFYYDKLLNDINILVPPYSEKYPELKNLFKEAGYPMRNKAENNVVYNCLNFITTWHRMDQLLINVHYLMKEDETVWDALKKNPIWYEQKNNILSANLDFLDDFENVDFNDINNKIKKLNPHFKAIPFDKIGLKN